MYPDTLDQHVLLIKSLLSPQLIGPRNIIKICRSIQNVPIALSHQFIFECALLENKIQSDFAFCINKSTGQNLLLENYLKTHLPNLDSLFRIVQYWNKAGSPLFDIPSIWLELDTSQKRGMDPSFFCNLNIRDKARINSLIPQIIGLYLKQKMPSQVSHILENLLNHLPSPSRPNWIGFMTSRPTAPYRLCITDMPLNGVIPYLNAVGYSWGLEEAKKTIGEWGQFLDPYTVLHLDFNESLQPKLGFEFTYHDKQRFGPDKGWESIFNHLQKKGFCTAEQKDHFVKWPRKKYYTDPNTQDRIEISCFINHLKINCNPQEKPEVKIYLHVTTRKISADKSA